MKKYLSVLFAAAVLLLLLCSCSSEEKLDIVHVTDIHFAGREYFDYEGIYAESNDSNGSGKQMKYLDDILDALFEDMEEDLIDAEAGLIPDDVDPLIYHFAFTCDWGRKEDAHVEIDGKQHSLKSAGDLYDILVKIREENTNER